MCTATQQQRVPAARTRASQGLNELDSVILDETSTYQCQVEVRARICNASSCVILRLDSFGYAKHPKDTSVTSGVLIGEQLWILVDGVCPDNLSLDSKSKLSHGLTSDHYWSLLYHCFYLVPICFLLVFWFFSFWSLEDWRWLRVIDGGLTRLDWQDLRSIIKGRKCSNEKVARVGADGVLSTYWNRFMKYIDYCTILYPEYAT